MKSNHARSRGKQNRPHIITLELTDAAYTLLRVHALMYHQTPEAAALDCVRSHVETITQIQEEEISDAFAVCAARRSREAIKRR